MHGGFKFHFHPFSHYIHVRCTALVHGSSSAWLCCLPTSRGAYPPQGGAYPPQGGAYPPQVVYTAGAPYLSVPAHLLEKWPDTTCEACIYLREVITRQYLYQQMTGKPRAAIQCNPNPRICLPIHIGIGIFFLVVGITLAFAIPGEFEKIMALRDSGRTIFQTILNQNNTTGKTK
eukprot:sb/3471966/